MEPQKKSHKTIGIAIGAAIVVAIILIAVFSGRKMDEQSATATDQSSPALPVDAANTTAVYKDGTYSATGSYISPGGLDHVGVQLTLANDIITAITVTPEPGDKMSAKYQNMFASGYKQYVIGMNIADVQLSKVSGSSLTSQGFNDAISQIEVQAKA